MAGRKPNTETGTLNPAPIIENELAETITVDVVEVGNSNAKNTLNLSKVSSVPKGSQFWNSFSKTFEPLQVDKHDFSNVKNEKGQIIQTVLVYTPLQIGEDINQEKLDSPMNAPRLAYLPAETLFNCWQTIINQTFAERKQVFKGNEYLNTIEKPIFSFRNTFEIFAFIKCVKEEHIIEYVKDVLNKDTTRTKLKETTAAIIRKLQRVEIGSYRISIDNILHLPFFNLQREIIDIDNITDSFLESTYQEIINRL